MGRRTHPPQYGNPACVQGRDGGGGGREGRDGDGGGRERGGVVALGICSAFSLYIQVMSHGWIVYFAQCTHHDLVCVDLVPHQAYLAARHASISVPLRTKLA